MTPPSEVPHGLGPVRGILVGAGIGALLWIVAYRIVLGLIEELGR